VLHTLVLGSLLGGNNIGDRGAIALAEALKINVTLQELYLSDGMIGDAGAMALAEGLKVNGVRSLHAQTDQPSLPEFRVQSLLEPEKRQTGWDSPTSHSQGAPQPSLPLTLLYATSFIDRC